jgi:hypothetical protein
VKQRLPYDHSLTSQLHIGKMRRDKYNFCLCCERILPPMRPFALLIAVMLLVSACNLNTQVAITPIDTDSTDETGEAPTPLPGVDVVPDGDNPLPTRTPVGTVAPRPPSQVGIPAGEPALLPTSETGESASITSPTNGATLQNGVVEVSGIVRNLPQDAFTLAFVAPNGVTINEQTITVNNPNQVADVPWTAAFQVTRYTGQAEIRLTAQTRGGETLLLARTQVTFAEGGGSGGVVGGSGAAAPQSATQPSGSITSPFNNSTVTGGVILVSGTAGGFEGGQFNIELVADGGTILATTLITITSSDYTRIVPWAGSLTSSGYTGAAEIRAYIDAGGQKVVFATTQVMIQ